MQRKTASSKRPYLDQRQILSLEPAVAVNMFEFRTLPASLHGPNEL